MVVVAMLAVWIMGKRSGARDAYAIAASQLSSQDAQKMISQLQSSLRENEVKLQNVSTTLQSRNALAENLQRRLDELMRQNSSDQHDLALYRRIEDPDSERRAVDLESIVWSSSQPKTIELTLVQWNGRGFLKGTLNVSVFYKSEQITETQSELSEQGGFENQGLLVDIAPVDFEFRFFQKIEMPIPSDFIDVDAEKFGDRVPNDIRVRINPANRLVSPVDITIPWNDITE